MRDHAFECAQGEPLEADGVLRCPASSGNWLINQQLGLSAQWRAVAATVTHEPA